MLFLLKNPTFIFLCLAGATEATLIAGMSTFGPKFLESQFSLSASEAATWFGKNHNDTSIIYVLYIVSASWTSALFFRLHGGASWWRWHLIGWLHCKEAKPQMPRNHPLLHAVCAGQSDGYLHLSPSLSERAHGRCDGPLFQQLTTQSLQRPLPADRETQQQVVNSLKFCKTISYTVINTLNKWRP